MTFCSVIEPSNKIKICSSHTISSQSCLLTTPQGDLQHFVHLYLLRMYSFLKRRPDQEKQCLYERYKRISHHVHDSRFYLIPVIMTEIKATIPDPPTPDMTLPTIACQRERAVPLIRELVGCCAKCLLLEMTRYGLGHLNLRYDASNPEQAVRCK